MKLVKKSNFVNGDAQGKKYPNDLDQDINNIVVALSGKLRFGDGTDGTGGENISGQFQQFTSDGTANTEFTVAHTVGSVPVGVIVLWQDKAGSLYQGPTTGTAWTATNIYLKCSVASVTFKVFLLK